MLLSPEIKVAEVPGRDVVIRLDDMILGMVFLAWLARIAIYKELGVLRHTRLNKPIAIYASCCILFTLLGIMRGDVGSAQGFFYLMKYLEYFLIFFMTVNILERKSQARLYLVFLLVTCGLVSAHAAAHIGTVSRISAPFEGAGEPNTLGGYLTIMTAIAIGMLVYNPPKRVKLLLVGLVGLTTLCVTYTLSRCTYMAFPVMYVTILIFSKKKKKLVWGLLLAIVALFAFRPKVITDRIVYTFVSASGREKPEKILGIPVGPSASARIRSWRKETKEIWTNRPLLGITGVGATGRGFLDGQYVRTFIELGILGFAAFMYLLFCMFRSYRLAFRSVPAGPYKGLMLGLLGAFVGILAHAVTANSFIIIRIQEPLWFLTAMAIRIPEIEAQS
jgi:hypothetical protein